MSFSVAKVYLLTLVSLSLFCYSVKAQSIPQDLSIQLKSAPLVEVFGQIKAQTGYNFAYLSEEVDDARLLTLKRRKQSLHNFLKWLSDEFALNFNAIGKVIYVKPKLLQSGQGKELQLIKKNRAIAAFIFNGKVIDENTREPLIGAVIQAEDADLGTVSDASGNFTLNIDSSGQVFRISYLGYQTKVITIDKSTANEIALKPAFSILDEVIVIGYNEKKVKDLTGAVGVLKVDDIYAQPVNSIEQAIQGRVAGVQVTGEGAPGGGISVRIRGYGTLGDNEPLYVVDGVPIKSQPDEFNTAGLNQFNLNDVESVQVLKDAAATAIYGSRAANGVVIITTKKGNYSGEQKVTLDAYYGFQRATNLPQMLNTQQYADQLWQAQKNAGLIPSNDVFGSDPSAPTIPEFLNTEMTIMANEEGTDWFEELFETAPVQSYNLGFQSGNERSRMAFSAAYFNQDGIMQYTGFERYTIRSNTEFKTSKDLVTIGQNLIFSYSDRTSVPTNTALGSRIIHAYRMNPIVPVRDIDGNWASSVKGVQGAENPVALNYFDRNDERINSRIFGNAYAQIQPLTGLILKTDFGIDYNIFDFKNYSPRYQMGDAIRAVNSFDQVNRNSLNWIWKNTLNYNKVLGKHTLAGVLGTEAITFSLEEFGASRDNFFSDDLDYVYLSSGEGAQTNFGNGTQWALFSIFGRLDYAYENKYLLGASLRRDGSSRFTSNNRYAVFPAFSLGWRLSAESFLSSLNWLSDLKIRLSWGQSGNQEIGNFASFSSFATNSNDTNYDLNGTNSTVTTGFTPNRLGNPNIVWETTTQTNFGLDLSLFDFRLGLSLDYFLKQTEDILLQRPTLAIEGQADAPFVNAGEMENQGLELQLNYQGAPIGDFTYDIGVNATVIRNEVIALADDVLFIPGIVSNSSTRNLTISRTEVGAPIAQLYGYVIEGIFNSQNEVDNHAEQPGKAIGRLKYRDLDGNDLIDDRDRTIIGNPHPSFVYGGTVNARFKNFDFSMFWQGVQGVDLYNFTRYYTDFYYDLGNRHSRLLDAWTPSNTGTTVPRIASVDVNNELRPSTYFVEDGSFLRLKNLQIGYRFQLNPDERNRIRVFLQGSNLITITPYEGLDPEVSLATYSQRDRNLDLGVDRGIYPNSQVISFGLQAEF